MKTIQKYMLKEFFKPFIGTIFTFSIIFCLSEIFILFNKENRSKDTLQLFIIYIFAKTPVWLSSVLPITMLLGFLFSYTTLVKSNEITAVKAGGININELFKPIIYFSVVISFLILLSNQFIFPYLNKTAMYIYKTKILSQQIENRNEYLNIVYIGHKESKYLIKKFNAKNNTLEKINIDFFDKNMTIKKQIYAEKAIWNNNKWIFQKGLIRIFDSITNNVIEEKKFDQIIINIPEKPDDFKTEYRSLDDMSITDIKRYADTLHRNSLPSNKERSQMHLKIAFPFANMIVILIGIAFTSLNLRSNKIISFALSLVVSFIYWGLVSVGIALGENRVLPPMLSAWITNIIFAIGSIYCFKYIRR
jgi:lipopolysaccharide export system permease protein